ncbi:MAG: helix-turn-helix domain-containing protein [Clostridia bacterium]|nr:helix-turn-helix domain-containing protein [Clostridia bacterium]
MDQQKIGRYIAECRKQKNLTQEQLAEKIGVTSKSVSRWENGKTMPDVSLFEPLCKELGISFNSFLSGENTDNGTCNITPQELEEYKKLLKKQEKGKLETWFNSVFKSRAKPGTLEAKYFNSISNLLLVVAFSVVNIILLLLNSGSYFLFSAFIPYLAVDSAMFLCGLYPEEYYYDVPDIVFQDKPYFYVMLAVAFAMLGVYLLCWYLARKKKVGALVFALVFFVLDTAAMLLMTELSIIDMLIHIWVISYLIIGLSTYRKMKKAPDVKTEKEAGCGNLDNGQVETMNVNLRQAAWMNFLYDALSDLNDDDFVERLDEEMQEEALINVLNSADEKTKSLFVKPYAVEEIKEYLKVQSEAYKKLSAKNQAQFLKALEGFENSDYLKEHFSSGMKLLDIETDDSSVFIQEFTDTVFRKITFENAEVFLDGEPFTEKHTDMYYDFIRLTKDNGVYVLEAENIDMSCVCVIRFTDISVTLKAYSADSDSQFWLFVNTPWDYLAALANGINAHIRYGLANPKEKKLVGIVMHLLGEKIEGIDAVPAQIYQLIEKHNLKNAAKAPYDFSKPYFCKKKFEPLWREIFAMVCESQEGLPSYFEEKVSKEDFESHKKLITDQMSAWGYTGTYPDFYKKDSTIKPTLLRTYNLSHVIAFEKYTDRHIHCYSFWSNGVIHTAFFIGTVFNKTETETSDIYSSMFDCNGRAAFSILSTVFTGSMSEQTYESWTKNAVKAAVRKAELKKADKDDFHFKSVFERGIKINFWFVLLSFVIFSLGFSLITPLILFILEGDTLPEIIAFLKSNPLLLALGPISGLLATVLFVIFEVGAAKK